MLIGATADDMLISCESTRFLLDSDWGRFGTRAHGELRQSYGELCRMRTKGRKSFNLFGERCVDSTQREPRRRYCFPGLQVHSSKGRKQTERQQQQQPAVWDTATHGLHQNWHPSSIFPRLSSLCACGYEYKKTSPAGTLYFPTAAIDSERWTLGSPRPQISSRDTKADFVLLNGQLCEHRLHAEVVVQIYREWPEAWLLSQLLIKHSSSQSHAGFNKILQRQDCAQRGWYQCISNHFQPVHHHAYSCTVRRKGRKWRESVFFLFRVGILFRL